MKKWGRNVGKIGGYVAGVREFENGGQKPLGPLDRAPKKIEYLIFGKSIGKRLCCEVSPHRCKSKSKRRHRRIKTINKGVEKSEKFEVT